MAPPKPLQSQSVTDSLENVTNSIPKELHPGATTTSTEAKGRISTSSELRVSLPRSGNQPLCLFRIPQYDSPETRAYKQCEDTLQKASSFLEPQSETSSVDSFPSFEERMASGHSGNLEADSSLRNGKELLVDAPGTYGLPLLSPCQEKPKVGLKHFVNFMVPELRDADRLDINYHDHLHGRIKAGSQPRDFKPVGGTMIFDPHYTSRTLQRRDSDLSPKSQYPPGNLNQASGTRDETGAIESTRGESSQSASSTQSKGTSSCKSKKDNTSIPSKEKIPDLNKENSSPVTSLSFRTEMFSARGFLKVDASSSGGRSDIALKSSTSSAGGGEQGSANGSWGFIRNSANKASTNNNQLFSFIESIKKPFHKATRHKADHVCLSINLGPDHSRILNPVKILSSDISKDSQSPPKAATRGFKRKPLYVPDPQRKYFLSAATAIKKGEVIVVEPCRLVTTESSVNESARRRKYNLEKTIGKLDPISREYFRNLDLESGGYSAIHMANCFQRDEFDHSMTRRFYTNISRSQHSCDPNARLEIFKNEKDEAGVLIATKDIERHHQITICYKYMDEIQEEMRTKYLVNCRRGCGRCNFRNTSDQAKSMEEGNEPAATPPLYSGIDSHIPESITLESVIEDVLQPYMGSNYHQNHSSRTQNSQHPVDVKVKEVRSTSLVADDEISILRYRSYSANPNDTTELRRERVKRRGRKFREIFCNFGSPFGQLKRWPS